MKYMNRVKKLSLVTVMAFSLITTVNAGQSTTISSGIKSNSSLGEKIGNTEFDAGDVEQMLNPEKELGLYVVRDEDI